MMHEPKRITHARELIADALKIIQNARAAVINSPLHLADPDYEQVILGKIIDAEIAVKQVGTMLPKLFEGM